MDLNLNLNVQIGVTPQLADFLTAILQARPWAISQPAVGVPAEQIFDPIPEPVAAEAPIATEEPAPEVIDFTPAVETQAQELTESDIRACMHRTRQRFEGEDYKDNTDSEGYKKYHKALTGMFKNIAVFLGADKPSALPAEQREAFIKECDDLIIDSDGRITRRCPF